MKNDKVLFLFLNTTPDSIDNMVGWQYSLVQEDLTWLDWAGLSPTHQSVLTQDVCDIS